MRKILIASDHAGFGLKEKIKPFLSKIGFKVNDLGTYSEDSCDYPEFAYKLAKAISLKKAPMGVLICKSGIGNSIAANKLPGVRAALVYNLKAAKLSRQHNDSNVLVLGSAFVPPALAKRIIKVWVATGFEGGRHKRRLDLIKKIERGIKK